MQIQSFFITSERKKLTLYDILPMQRVGKYIHIWDVFLFFPSLLDFVKVFSFTKAVTWIFRTEIDTLIGTYAVKNKHTHTHTHTHIYICMYVCMYLCVCVYKINDSVNMELIVLGDLLSLQYDYMLYH